MRSKEEALAEHARQLDAERAQVEELETALLAQVRCVTRSMPPL